MKVPCSAVSRMLLAALLALCGRPAGASVANLTDAVQLDVGGRHACVVTSAGAVKCWGDNTHGILGDGTVEARSWASDVVGLPSAAQSVATSRGWTIDYPDLAHTCAITVLGQVACWGDNTLGQLGLPCPSNPTRPSSGICAPVYSSSPVVPELPNTGVRAVAVTAGWAHTCALLSDGTVLCWGDNRWGQIGDGTTNLRRTPTRVPGLSDIVQIAAGPSHTCAMTAAGGVKCWGSNASGALGSGVVADSTVPIDVSGLSSGVVSITAGGTRTLYCQTAQNVTMCNYETSSDFARNGHTCALLASGAAKCWGENELGQLGTNDTAQQRTPADVAIAESLAQISAGGIDLTGYSQRVGFGPWTGILGGRTCALTAGGRVKCWGLDFCGALGRGGPAMCNSESSLQRTNPADVAGVTNASGVAAGGEFACALLTGGTVSCWGLGYGDGPLSIVAATSPEATRPGYGGGSARLANISTRGNVFSGDEVLIGGFVIGGPGAKTVAIVANGPSLLRSGITDPLAAPTITLVRMSDKQIVATSDAWTAEPEASQVHDSGFAPREPAEAAVVMTLPPGAYTAIVQGANGGTGVTLLGVYEVDHPESPLVNMSTRGHLQVGDDFLIGGFIIGGSSPHQVAIVATGPSLAASGVPATLKNPSFALVRMSDGAVIASNDDWGTDPNAAQLQAKGFAPSDPREAGMLITLQPGAYTALVTDASGQGGTALIGVYNAP